jgi:hypothetical protein
VIPYLRDEANGSQNVPQLCFKKTAACVFRVKPGINGSAIHGAAIGTNEFKRFRLPEVDDPAWFQLQTFSRCPWFVRKWVIQETVLTRVVTFVCGAWSVARKEFHGLLPEKFSKQFNSRPYADYRSTEGRRVSFLLELQLTLLSRALLSDQQYHFYGSKRSVPETVYTGISTVLSVSPVLCNYRAFCI